MRMNPIKLALLSFNQLYHYQRYGFTRSLAFPTAFFVFGSFQGFFFFFSYKEGDPIYIVSCRF